jgi:hypothetical protein
MHTASYRWDGTKEKDDQGFHADCKNCVADMKALEKWHKWLRKELGQ